MPRQSRILSAVFFVMAGTTPLSAGHAATVQSETVEPEPAPETRFVVFTHPGENWDRVKEYGDLLPAHAALYWDMADAGDIVVGGRFEGEPVLGLSVFRQDINEDQVRLVLEADPLVEAGVITVEFRTWVIQMGDFSAG